MTQRKLPEWLSDEQVAALAVQITPKTTTGLCNRAMIAAMLGGGLRVSEVVVLNGCDVDLRNGTLLVRSGKGERQRRVAVDGETLSWLAGWACKREDLGLGNRPAPFFPRLRTKGLGKEGPPRGGRLSVRTVQNLVTRLVRRAGFERLGVGIETAWTALVTTL